MATTSKKSASKNTKTSKSTKSTNAKSTSKSATTSKKTTAKKSATLAVKSIAKKVDAKATNIKATPVKTSLKMLQLRKWNISMAVLHGAQAVAVLMLAKAGNGIQQVTTNYLTTDSLHSTAEKPVLVSATRHLFDVNLAWLVVAFFALSAAAHFSIATWYRKRYEHDLADGINRARWIEYGLSASVMMVAIGFLSGIGDLSTLIAIFALDLVMNLLGLAMEVHNHKAEKVNWITYNIGVIAGIVPWIIFAVYVLGAHQYGASGVPGFVYWIYASIFLFFNTFALNMYRQYKKKGRWTDYLFGEKVYMILSLVAKSALAWQVFAGTLRP